MAGVAYTDHETFGGHATWNAELGVEAGAGGRVVASAGSGFRAPDATDLYGFGGNPALDPEESTSYEIGYRQRLRILLDDALRREDPDFAAELRAQLRGLEAQE